MQVSRYTNYKNVIDLGVLQRTNMMITIFNKPVKNQKILNNINILINLNFLLQY